MSERHRESIMRVPILGVIRAGHPIPFPDAGSPPLDWVEIPRSTSVPPDGIFGLQVRGDSMVEANIFDGDTIIIKPQKTAVNGDLVVARLLSDPTNPETAFKRFYRQGDLIYLQPENSAYRALIIGPKDVEIIGIVLAVWRKSIGDRQRVQLVA